MALSIEEFYRFDGYKVIQMMVVRETTMQLYYTPVDYPNGRAMRINKADIDIHPNQFEISPQGRNHYNSTKPEYIIVFVERLRQRTLQKADRYEQLRHELWAKFHMGKRLKEWLEMESKNGN